MVRYRIYFYCKEMATDITIAGFNLPDGDEPIDDGVFFIATSILDAYKKQYPELLEGNDCYLICEDSGQIWEKFDTWVYLED